MHINDYIDSAKLAEHIRNGLVDVRNHPFLPLVLYCHSRRCTLENIWDEVTTKTRGLIVNRNTLQVVSRPFEKFFNVNTSWKPETLLENLPNWAPTTQEKLDGSLGILYTVEDETGIATKGSFMSEQAIWATNFYRKYHDDADWPIGYTPVFEIICESVQHHVVHYNGHERLVLLALVQNDTGEELNQHSLHLWARLNHIECAQQYEEKFVTQALQEDRPNTEGYVLSWRREGQSPLKVKVKHPGFLALQKVVHAATPKAILEHLKAGNTDLLDTWIGQTNDALGTWVQGWVAKFNLTYGSILQASYRAVMTALERYEQRKEQAEYILSAASANERVIPSVSFAVLDHKDHKKAIWKAVDRHFEKELGQSFSLGEDE